MVAALGEALESHETGIYLYNEPNRCYELRAVTDGDFGNVQHLKQHIDEPDLSRSRTKSLGTGLLHLTPEDYQSDHPFSRLDIPDVLHVSTHFFNGRFLQG